jgi:hypothetical protein
MVNSADIDLDDGSRQLVIDEGEPAPIMKAVAAPNNQEIY